MSVREFLETKYESFCDYMDHDTRGVEIGVYTVSGLLFAVAYYKKRPITKFVAPSDVPKTFIKNKVLQYGFVAKVEPASSLLMVQHKPPVNIFFTSKKTLPVKISGIEVNANGYSWLQSVAVNNNVEFIPIKINPDNAECKVVLTYKEKNKRNLDLAQALLSLGLARATVPPELPITTIADAKIMQYLHSLPSIEKRAKNKRMGMWFTSLPPPILPVRLYRFAWGNVVTYLTPESKRLPEILR